MAEAIILGWVVLVGLVALNGTAAGIAALLQNRSGPAGRGNRVLFAALGAGALPASLMIVVPLAEDGAGERPSIWLLATAVVLLVCTGVSLPGAIVVSRKLAKPDESFRTFE